DARTQLALAELCTAQEKRHEAAVRLYVAAFAAAPKRADDLSLGHRRDAARAAALAAADKNEDANQTSNIQRAGFRQRALGWLQADLAGWTGLLQKGPQAALIVNHTLEVCEKDADLAGVRDRPALAMLSPDEQKAWQQFWADLATLRQRAAA